MKTFTKSIWLVAGLTFAATSSPGDTFKYSYSFGDGTVVSGFMVGTQNGIYLENVSDLSLYVNGVKNPLESAFQGPSTVSFDAAGNNFLIVNEALGSPDIAYFFYVPLGSTTDMFAGYANHEGMPDETTGMDLPAVNANWSLERVPEGGSTAVMVGFVLLAFSGLRRKPGRRSAD